MNMHWVLGLSPLIAYLVAGSLKFAVNSLRSRRPAWEQVGMGSFPSTHTAIVACPLTLVALREGIATPVFGLGFALLVVVVIDAMDLRRRVGTQAQAINALRRSQPAAGDSSLVPLRERTGHSAVEVAGGLLVGATCALVLDLLAAPP
jgi:acid phosphatase family membrane protein YuiD